MSKLNKFIVDKNGQWAHPGKPTMIPDANGRITMQGVPYPVYGIDDQGNAITMMPGGEYQFPGNDVYEIPMIHKKLGGDPSIPDLSNRGWLSKYQKGGGREPIYVTDKNDPRFIAYNDSLNSVLESSNLIKEAKKRITKNYDEGYDSPKDYLSYYVGNRRIPNYREIKPIKTYYRIGQDLGLEIPIYKNPTQPVIYRPEPEVKPIASKPGVLPITDGKGLMPSKKLQVKEGLVPTRETYYANFNPNHPDAGKIIHYHDPVKKQIVKNPEYELRKDGGWLSQYRKGGNANFDAPYLTSNTNWLRVPEGTWVMGMQDGGIMKLQNAEKKPIYTAAKGFNDYIINVTLSKSGGSTQGDWLNKYK